ncbi:uncharacterized protein PITG_05880 [Phytophthora infestans T30-4]|uniref:Uncharacterized protein n=1 Tax=Phytophthora infestans (strain T30-4) TaxID=403677 RepID=D0N5W7_PHYIT|nr:uncharacterized protein PITG_05880 [Phytophthora infestans T30-4]EEY70458.1 conserved hypothetical protein [Phytophthora infestans T30-4]|eukprot:XP_002998112.1 conserved hypothetical protein [Phytophthora infestans T30-4]
MLISLKLCVAINDVASRSGSLRLQPELMQTLSLLETQLIHAYDLSRLDVFEVQAYLQTIDRWCAKVERSKRRQLAIGFVTPPTLQLRPSIPSKRRRKKWVHVPIEGQDAADVQEEGASPPKFRIQSEIVCFRLPIASVGCGIIALTTTLQVLDLSNDEAGFGDEAMDNEIGTLSGLEDGAQSLIDAFQASKS